MIRLTFQAKAKSGRPVPNVSPEWSLSPGNAQIDADGNFVADLPGTYRISGTFAGRTAETSVQVRPRDVRRPTTLVGRLPLRFQSAEFWLHPDGRHGYLSTIGDRVYAIDVSNPAAPVITDSVVVDARAVNDIMTTEDGKFGVLTRENASTRKNGIVILSFEDPAHPKPIAEFTETVTGGVHSTFIYRGYVYLTDDATGSLRVIDIRDPYKPRQVARWQTRPDEAGNFLHDIDVKDGLAYLSYWNQGLVILDVGKGIKGGSPENPQLVSQYKYDLNSLYRDVEAVGGPGFIRGTHTAWRAGKYVFVGDEVFSARPRRTEGGGVVGLGRAYGRLHVIDVSDLARPKEVAYYEPKDGGSHNVWVAGDTLYMGDYQGGLQGARHLRRAERRFGAAGPRDRSRGNRRPRWRHTQRSERLGSHLQEWSGLRSRHQLGTVDRAGGAEIGTGAVAAYDGHYILIMATPQTVVIRTFTDRAEGLSHFVLRAGEAPRLLAFDDALGCPVETALAALEWTGAVGVLQDDDLLHAARLTSETAAAVIERKVQNGRRYVYLGPRLDAPPMDVFEGAILFDEPGVKAVEFTQRAHGLAHFLRATAGAGALLALLGRRAPEIRHLRRWLGPIIQELDLPRPLVAGWFAASSAGCLFSSPEGEPTYRYIEVGTES